MSTCVMLCLFNYLLPLNYLLVFSLSPEVLGNLYYRVVLCLINMNLYAMIWVTQNCIENI